MEWSFTQVSSDQDECRVWYNGFFWVFDFAQDETIVGYTLPFIYRGGYAAIFRNIDIPAGSHIAGARLLLWSESDTHKQVVNSYLNCELSVNPAQFVDIADYWARPRAPWGIPWDNIRRFYPFQYYMSENFPSQVQQVIDLPDWVPGKDICVFWNDHGGRSTEVDDTIRKATTHHHDPARSPRLRITYTPPTQKPPPPVPDAKWALENLTIIPTKTGFKLVAQTDVPCHLYMRWSLIPPKQHLIPAYRRGIAMHTDKYFCFDAYTDNEQAEPYDTIIHTFIKEPWEVCETRWFYFQGTVAGDISPSTSPIFEQHRIHQDLQIRISAPTDDCQKGIYYGTPYFGTDYGYNAAGFYAWYRKEEGCGLRFQNVNLPPTAIIDRAFLRFRCYTIDERPGVKSKLRGHRHPNSPTFSTVAEFDARIRTNTTIRWDGIEPWTPGNDYDSLDITPLVEEIRSLPAWLPGHPMTFFWDDFDGRTTSMDAGSRWAQSFDSIPAVAPLLVILHHQPGL